MNDERSPTVTVPGPVPAVPSAPDREADLTQRVEAAIFEVALGNHDEPVAAEVIALVREQVARDIEREGPGFSDTWNLAVKRCAAIARGVSS